MDDQAGIFPIEFIDLKAQRDRVRDRVEEGWRRVVDHGQYIMGPEVRGARSAAWRSSPAPRRSCRAPTAPMRSGCRCWPSASGPGDAVFLPSWTFTATAEVACLVGATPVFVDVDPDTMNLRRRASKRRSWLGPPTKAG